MSATASKGQVNIGRLILVPALITLAITVLRLVGELNHWDPKLFNPAAGGGGALVGIAWLPFVFGVYFALKVSAAGEGPASAGRPILFYVLGVVIVVIVALIAFRISQNPTPVTIVVFNAGVILATWLQRKPWPALFRTLLAYAFAARVPVAVLMFFAIWGNWGTHYDAPPKDFPAMHWFLKWLLIGVLPQMVLWVGYTVLVGGLVGSIAGAIAQWRKHAEHAAAAS